MALKVTQADKHFSLCIREAAEWKCEKCHTYYPEGRRQGLHCSHYHGRGKWGLRFVVDNAAAHCYGCHQHLSSNPLKHQEWRVQHIGQGACDILLEKSNDTALGRLAKRNQKEISKHYREEHKRLKELRAQGVKGKLEINSWG